MSIRTPFMLVSLVFGLMLFSPQTTEAQLFKKKKRPIRIQIQLLFNTSVYITKKERNIKIQIQLL